MSPNRRRMRQCMCHQCYCCPHMTMPRWHCCWGCWHMWWGLGEETTSTTMQGISRSSIHQKATCKIDPCSKNLTHVCLMCNCQAAPWCAIQEPHTCDGTILHLVTWPDQVLFKGLAPPSCRHHQVLGAGQASVFLYIACMELLQAEQQ